MVHSAFVLIKVHSLGKNLNGYKTFFNNWKKQQDDDDVKVPFLFRKSMQRNKQMAMGRKKFNMDPKKVKNSTSDFM